ncbi:4Fe-4S dicluster domain-containing protein [bacterium]|nr:4Fe-4S dicluster domain-containing protein [bacterium]
MTRLKNLKELFDHLSKSSRIVGLKKAGNRYLYQVLEQYDDWQSSVLLGAFSPKELFFPQDEALFHFKAQNVIAPKHEERQQVLFGVRPCDIRGIWELEKMFNQTEYRDPYFMKRFERTLIVGMACAEPLPTCFCTSVQGSPYESKGSDIFIYSTGQGYLLDVITKKGEEALAGLSFETVEDRSKIEADRTLAESKIKEYDLEGVAEKLKVMVDSKFWEETHFTCIGCGTCAFVCPSCHCFDISDDSKGSRGKRSRQWDSCLYKEYTIETSGHNPRPSGAQRWRQRLNHKFNYFHQVFGMYQCLGCGRCGRACPVNINIAELASKAVTWEESKPDN